MSHSASTVKLQEHFCTTTEEQLLRAFLTTGVLINP